MSSVLGSFEDIHCPFLTRPAHDLKCVTAFTCLQAGADAFDNSVYSDNLAANIKNMAESRRRNYSGVC
jgi:hypothetical protein